MMSPVFIVFATLLHFTYQSSWTYDAETHWPGQCTNGKYQSPIDIVTKNTMIDHHQRHIQGPLHFRGYQRVLMGAINNGHTLRWDVGDDYKDSLPVLSGGPLRGNYTLMQFHLHWLSEHSIDGIKYPLEIHFVHVKSGLTQDEALLRPDGLVVVGVLCQVQVDEMSNHVLEELMPDVPNLLHRNESYEVVTKQIDVSRLLGPDPQSYYTYTGSLTTPNCEEVVTWIVMDKPLMISDIQYKQFSRVDVGGINNYRSVQPLGNRIVYRSVASCSSILIPGLIHTVTGASVLVSCILHSVTTAVSKVVCPILNWKKYLLGIPMKDCLVVTS